MSGKNPILDLAEKTAIGILVVLVGVNALWAVTLRYSGPIIALLCYALVAFLCWRRKHFQAGIMGGIFGLGIHVYELILQDVRNLGGISLVFFCANIVLPLPLIYFSYKASRKVC